MHVGPRRLSMLCSKKDIERVFMLLVHQRELQLLKTLKKGKGLDKFGQIFKERAKLG